jgi:thiol:disulfide interchange protein DsbC
MRSTTPAADPPGLLDSRRPRNTAGACLSNPAWHLPAEIAVTPRRSFVSPLASVAAVVALAFAAYAVAQTAARPDPKPDPKADPRVEIAKKFEVTPADVRPSPLPGLYEVTHGAEVGYVSTDGKFYIDGDLYDMTSSRNLTEQRRQAGRLALLNAVPDSEAIVFSPKDPKYTITVFTDMDCTYCRRLHGEIGELNRLGVRVRYLAYPRSGPGGDGWKKAEAVWCSADRNDALTRAKRGEEIKAPNCKNPVAKQYELGDKVGVRGTPGIVTDKGQYIGGYLPAPRLVAHLKELQAQQP